MVIIKVFFVGWVILTIAIFINLLEAKFGITTWYSFLQDVGKMGLVKAFIQISLISKLVLFIIYPFLLGLVAFIFLKK